MSWSFKPGDRVVCVNAENPRNPRYALNLQKGRVYTITEVFPPDGWGHLGLFLAEHDRNHPIAADRFRPVRTTSIESLRQHLNTIPANRRVNA